LKSVIGHQVCEKKAVLVKYDRSHFLESIRKSRFATDLGIVMLKEKIKRERYKKNSWRSKACYFSKMLITDLKSNDIFHYFSIGYNFLIELTYLNEYFALLLTNTNKKKFLRGNYSFKSNLFKCLKLSIQYEKDLENLIFEGESFDDFNRLVLLVNRVKIFVNNLNHILNSFQIN
jgi:hypothetical protein